MNHMHIMWPKFGNKVIEHCVVEIRHRICYTLWFKLVRKMNENCSSLYPNFG